MLAVFVNQFGLTSKPRHFTIIYISIWQTTPVFWFVKSHGQRSLMSHRPCPWGPKRFEHDLATKTTIWQFICVYICIWQSIPYTQRGVYGLVTLHTWEDTIAAPLFNMRYSLCMEDPFCPANIWLVGGISLLGIYPEKTIIQKDA